MHRPKNHYAILGVEPTATSDEISSAFRNLARQYHPDMRPEDEAASAHFKRINEAYEVLSDPAKRRHYDRREGLLRPHRDSAGRSSVWPKEPLGPSDAWPELDIQAELILTPEEAAWGGVCQCVVNLDEPCEECGGRGMVLRWGCPTCYGSGFVQRHRPLEADLPPGMRDGSVLQLRGAGISLPGSPVAGDLFLRVRVRPGW